MYAFVCTKHRRYLTLDDAREPSGMIVGLSPEPSVPDNEDGNWLTFDTSAMWCPENKVSEVLAYQAADAAMGPLSWKDQARILKQTEEADCSQYYAVIDEFGLAVTYTEPTDDSQRNGCVHDDWLQFDIYEGTEAFDRHKHLS
jgi:hypothetical protein